MKQILLVGIGGAIGSVLRYLVYLSVFKLCGPTTIPIGTLLVNLAGCFFFGVVIGSKEFVSWITPTTQVFLLTGVLGGFTTFSSFGYDLLVLIKSYQWNQLAIYLSASIIIGVLSVYLGYRVAQ